MPAEREETTGSLDARKLRTKPAATTSRTGFSFLAGGTMTAKNMAAYAKKQLKKAGLRVLTGTTLLGVAGEGRAEGVRTDAGLLPADLVIVAIGVRPATKFLEGSGLEMFKGTIVVDGQMKTNLPDVYAVGDCAMVRNELTGKGQWSAMGAGVTMRAPGKDKFLRLSFPDMKYLGVWHAPKTEAPYVCLEPWTSVPAMGEQRYQNRPKCGGNKFCETGGGHKLLECTPEANCTGDPEGERNALPRAGEGCSAHSG